MPKNTFNSLETIPYCVQNKALWISWFETWRLSIMLCLTVTSSGKSIYYRFVLQPQCSVWGKRIAHMTADDVWKGLSQKEDKSANSSQVLYI